MTFTESIQGIAEAKGGCVRLKQGEYVLREKDATPFDLIISNHRNAMPKRAALIVAHKNNLTIDGGGSRLLTDGFLIPVAITDSSHITLKNFTFDLTEPLFSEGEIVRVGEGFVDVRFLSERYRIKEGKLFFTVYGREYPPLQIMEFDTAKRLFCPTGDLAFGGDPCIQSAERLPDGVVRIHATIKTRLTAGNALIFRFGLRDNPTIVADNSQNINLENITIHSSHAMGLIAQRCWNVTIKQFTVTPRNHYVSLNADALHFVNCRGKIEITDSRFEYQLDDALNVHGVYGIIDGITGANRVKLSLKNEEQRGFRYLGSGDRIAFIHRGDMLQRGVGRVKAVSYEGDFIFLETEEDIPQDVEIGWGIENLSYNASLDMQNCYLHGNRARGVLISTPCGAELKKNIFDSVPGSAVLIAGDMNGWYESGSSKNIRIAENIIRGCGCVPMWGNRLLNICPELKEYRADEAYHTDITITENLVEQCHTDRFLFARSVNGLTAEDNRFDFTPIAHIEHSKSVKLQAEIRKN